MRSIARFLLGATIAAGFVFLAGTAAGAQTAAVRPLDPVLGDPVDEDVSPHGGYSASTNMCRQCHSVHNAEGEYALLWKSSVTETCATCHSLFGADPTGTRTPFNGESRIVGTTSARPAYEVVEDDGTPETELKAEHPIGEDTVEGNAITQSGWNYGGWKGGVPTTNSGVAAGPGTASVDDGGLYCGSCHTPHGDFGALVNAWTSPANDNQQIYYNPPGSASWTTGYLKLDTTRANPARNVPGVWQACTAPGGSTCVDLLVDDEDADSTDPAYLYGYKLLTRSPNHTYSSTKGYNTSNRGSDNKLWCTTCHTGKQDLEGDHTHATSCTYCHGNPADPDYPASRDFPHTSTMAKFLKQYPDELCISCHSSGRLP